MNYSGKIDLLKMQGAFATNIKGKAATKKCVCIPIEDSHLFVGEKGIYLHLFVRSIDPEKSVSGDSHLITQNLPKEVYDSLTDDQKKLQPILGSFREFQPKAIEVTTTVTVENADDVPF